LSENSKPKFYFFLFSYAKNIFVEMINENEEDKNEM
jgi:hypothetical protein